MAERLSERWNPDPQLTDDGRERYVLRSKRFTLEQAEDGQWAVVPPDGVPLAEGLDFEVACQMAEKHDLQAQRAAEGLESR